MHASKHLIIYRGLPGSGKTTAARLRVGPENVYAADDFFTSGDGSYHWNAAKVPAAHQECQRRVAQAMFQGKPLIAVANTHVARRHCSPYEQMAVVNGYTVEVIDLFDAGLSDEDLAARNVHAVPVETIARMRRSYER